WNPNIQEVLSHTAEWAQSEEDWWTSEIRKLGAGVVSSDGAVVEASTFRELPPAAARRLVRHLVGEVKGDLRGIDFKHIEAVLALAARTEGHGAVQAAGIEVCRSFDWLRFATPEKGHGYRHMIKPPSVVRVPGTRFRLSLEIIEIRGSPEDDESVYNGVM